MNRMKELLRYGQSVWLDYIHRSLFKSGELKKLIDEDGLRGMRSNATIFEKAVAHGAISEETIKAALADDPKVETGKICERLVIEDIRSAADILRPVYDETGGADGFVSIEVSPTLAHDTDGTMAEARRLKKEVNRPNIMIKVPATPAGIPAIEQLTSEGVNVNIKLMFSMGHYEAGARAEAPGGGAGGPRGRGGARARGQSARDRVGGVVLREPRRHAHRQGARKDRHARGARAARQDRHRQLQGGVPPLRGDFPRRGLRQAQKPRRPRAAAAVGEHRHEEPGVFRCALR